MLALDMPRSGETRSGGGESQERAALCIRILTRKLFWFMLSFYHELSGLTKPCSITWLLLGAELLLHSKRR